MGTEDQADRKETPEPRSGMSKRELNLRFTYHAPKSNQGERYEFLRGSAKKLAEEILDFTPESREQSLAITHLEQAVMWANAAIARREKE